MASCGICLRLIATAECPSPAAIALLPPCGALHAIGQLCEGDGECGTVRVANNCGTADVYKRCPSALAQPPWPPPAAALPPPRSPPPLPPQPPLAPMASCAATAECIAGASCGMCLRLVQNASCPPPAVADRLPQCAGIRPGEMCEGDGECGTVPTANNCEHRDIYTRVSCQPAPLAAIEEAAPPASAPAIGVALVGGGLLLVVGGWLAWKWVALKLSARANGRARVAQTATRQHARGHAAVEVPLGAPAYGGKAEALVVRNPL